MAAGDLINAPRQIEFNGLLLGSGTGHKWMKLTGWDELPNLDDSSSPRPDQHGDFPGLLYAQARIVTLTGLTEDAAASIDATIAALRAAMTVTVDELPLVVDDGGGKKVAYGRVVQRDIQHERARLVGYQPWAVQWKCTDPFRYDLATMTASLAPLVFTGGLVYPLVYPLDYGSAAGVSSVTGRNDGDAPAPVTVTFRGPGSGYAVSNAATGWRLGFDLPLAAGDTLTVDTRTGSVLLNGSTDRASTLSADAVPPELWRLVPGDNQVTYTVASGQDVTTGADLSWSNTYW